VAVGGGARNNALQKTGGKNIKKNWQGETIYFFTGPRGLCLASPFLSLSTFITTEQAQRENMKNTCN
jgi:hypothetical protein